jgi:hypothetical protein
MVFAYYQGVAPVSMKKNLWRVIEPSVGVSPVTSGRVPNSSIQLVNTFFSMRRFHDADTEGHS